MKLHAAIAAAFVVAAFASPARAQDRAQPATAAPEKPATGVTDRLAAALDALTPAPSESDAMRKLAVDMQETLARVDRSELGGTAAKLEQLEREEAELAGKLERWRAGGTVEVDAWWPRDSSQPPASEAAIELEAAELVAARALLAKREKDQIEYLQRAHKREQREKPNVIGNALLATLETLPSAPAPESRPSAAAGTSFPDRLARALYAAEDYFGALAQYRACKPSDLADGDRYAIARCLEETRDVPGAIAQLEEILKGAPSPFWKERAESLKRYLARQKSIDGVLKR
jgi:hypothetical protein